VSATPAVTAPPVQVVPEQPSAAAPPAAAPEPAAPAATAGSSTLSLVDVRRLWPDIVEATKQRRRVTWIHLTQHAQVVAVDAKTLTLGFSNGGARESFDNGGSSEIVRQAAIDVVGADWRVETIVDPGASADVPPPAAVPTPEPAAPRPAPPVARDEVEAPPAWLSDEGDAGPAAREAERPGPESVNAAREAIKTTRPAGAERGPAPGLAEADADAHPDDLDADSDELGGADLLARELGAQVIEEIPHS
jgi:DNA polymerase-3 subunit gamma/tau